MLECSCHSLLERQKKTWEELQLAGGSEEGLILHGGPIQEEARQVSASLVHTHRSPQAMPSPHGTQVLLSTIELHWQHLPGV